MATAGGNALVRLMVIDDHDIDAERLRFRQRLDAGRAAIDGHQERRAARGERSYRFDIRAVALEQPVGNMDERLDAGRRRKRASNAAEVAPSTS